MPAAWAVTGRTSLLRRRPAIGPLATVGFVAVAVAAMAWGMAQPGLRPHEWSFDPSDRWPWWPGPPGEMLILFVGGHLAVGAAAFLRRARSPVGQALLVGSSANAASITLWTTIDADQLAGPSASWVSFVAAGMLSLVLWSSLLHLIFVFPTPDPRLAGRRWPMPAVYVLPQVVLVAGAAATGALTPASLDWLDAWPRLHAAIVSVILVTGIIGIALRYRSVSRPRRRQVRGIAVVVTAAAAASLLLVDLPVMLGAPPILGREVVVALALPIPVVLGLALWQDRSFRLNRLRRSQMALLHAREEERRRLRRDLHDGLGPTLAAIGLKIDAAGSWVRSDPDAAERLLAEVRNDLSATVSETRRLVRGLRPPALDELGLAAAARRLAEELATGDRAPAITVVADELAALPAAVEVGAYRIVQEALTNTVRHAGAERAEVALRLDGRGNITITVSDDGAGFTQAARRGVGTEAMRERAEELGGELVVDSEPGRGTTVLATLPTSAR